MSELTSKESIFFAALGLPTVAERAAFLDGACGGDEGVHGRTTHRFHISLNANERIDKPYLSPTPPVQQCPA